MSKAGQEQVHEFNMKVIVLKVQMIKNNYCNHAAEVGQSVVITFEEKTGDKG